MSKEYVIRVNDNFLQERYFKCCYRYTQNNQKGTYFALDEKENAKRYKTKKTAENKVQFLREKQEENFYLSDYEFEIEEV